MCMIYRGTAYFYGLAVTVQLGSKPQCFHILITKHLKDRPYVYGGVCLENGIQVTTEEDDRFAALHDITKKIIDSYICAEKVYAERYPGEPVRPFKNIMECMMKKRPSLYRKFKKRMEKALSLDDYKTIRKKLESFKEQPRFDIEEERKKQLRPIIALQYHKALALLTFLKILPHCVPVLDDCKDMTLTLERIKKDTQLCEAEIKYRRV